MEPMAAPSAVQGTTRASAPVPNTGSAMADMTSDFETFLTLLTAQMRNQDPLKPMDSTEFVAQLASFSTVEQQIRTNDRLDSIAALLAGGPVAGLAEWLGREVRVAAKADFDGRPLAVHWTPSETAVAAHLVIHNDFGNEMGRIPIDAAAGRVDWSGDLGGSIAPHGRYRFTVEFSDGQSVSGRQDGMIYAPVTEARLGEGGTELILASGEAVALSAITGVR